MGVYGSPATGLVIVSPTDAVGIESRGMGIQSKAPGKLKSVRVNGFGLKRGPTSRSARLRLPWLGPLAPNLLWLLAMVSPGWS